MSAINFSVYHVTGWVQYKTDCAKVVDRHQVAISGEEAVREAHKSLCRGDEDWRAVLEWKELP